MTRLSIFICYLADTVLQLVHTIVLKDYVQSQVNTMARQLGETNYKEIINNVDVETRDNLMEYVSL